MDDSLGMKSGVEQRKVEAPSEPLSPWLNPPGKISGGKIARRTI